MFNIILLRIHLRSYKKLNKQKQSHCRQYYIIAESDDKSLKRWIKLNVWSLQSVEKITLNTNAEKK